MLSFFSLGFLFGAYLVVNNEKLKLNHCSRMILSFLNWVHLFEYVDHRCFFFFFFFFLYFFNVCFFTLFCTFIQVIDLKTQVIYLKNVKKHISKQLGDEGTKTLLSKAIYLFSVGGNDYLAPSSVFNSLSREDYVGTVIGNLTSVIKVRCPD